MTRSFSVVPMLARRFLLSKSSDGFLSFIAWVSVVGVALGVLALVVVTSVINGFEGELTRVITGTMGDVFLYSRADPVKDPEQIEEKIRHAVPDAVGDQRRARLRAHVVGARAGSRGRSWKESTPRRSGWSPRFPSAWSRAGFR